MRTILLLATTALLPAQTTLYLDARTGVDTPGGGSANQPLKTLTFAVTQATAPAVFRLRAGTYSAASGETFPITLPSTCIVEADPTRVAPGTGQVVIETALGTSSTMLATPRNNMNIALRELSLVGGMLRAVRFDSAANSVANVTLDSCSITQRRCVVVNAAVGSHASVVLRDCRLAGDDHPVQINADPQARVDLGLDRCTIRNGLRAGIVLDASGGGTVRMLLRHSTVGLGEARGIEANTNRGGIVVTRIEHCLLHDVGTRTVSGPVGALFDFVGATGLPPQHTIVNSLLHNNRSDAPAGLGSNYTWGTNLVTQADLVGVGGNQLGAAGFVEETTGNWHLVAGSAGIDAGRSADRTGAVDFDGDPYLGAPDLGPDEAHFAYTSGPTRAPLGGTLTLRPLVDPQTNFLVVLAAAASPSFGPGQWHLVGPVVDVGLFGVPDARGIGRVDLPVPDERALTNQALFWQTISDTPPWLGANALRTVFVGP